MRDKYTMDVWDIIGAIYKQPQEPLSVTEQGHIFAKILRDRPAQYPSEKDLARALGLRETYVHDAIKVAERADKKESVTHRCCYKT